MIVPHKITDVFFDLDHTLWDFERNSSLAFYKVFRHLNKDIDVELFLEFYAPINLMYWKMYRDEMISKQQLRRGRLNDAFAKMNLSFSVNIIDEMAELYIAFLPEHNYLFPGTLDLLNYLKPKYGLHIITNGFEEVQTKKLHGAGIAHFFNTMTNSEEAGVKKPNPAIFYHALNKAGAVAQQSVMVGDNFEADIEGALQVHMQAIYFSPVVVATPTKGVLVNNLLAIKSLL